MNEKSLQRQVLLKVESIVFIFIMTQYFGALGQYILVLPGFVKQVWSNLYQLAKILFIVLIALQGITKLKYTVKRKNFFLAILLVLLGSVSILESGVKNETIIFVLRIFMTIIIGIYVASHYPTKQLLGMLCKAQGIFLILTIIFAALFPQYAFFTDSEGQRVFIGIYTTKNPCAFELVYGAILFYIRFRTEQSTRKKVVAMCMVLVQLLLAFQCRSLGAILTGIIVIACSEVLLLKKKALRLDHLYLGINICFFVVILFLMPLFSTVMVKLGRDATLTGRTDIWMSIFQFLRRGNLLFGYGYESFWNNEIATASLYRFYATNGVKYNYTGAHNTLIELLLYFGLIGLTVYIIVVLKMLKQTRNFEGIEGLFILVSFFFFTIHGLVERSLSDSGYDTMIFIIMLAMTAHIGIPKRKKDVYLC